MPMASPRPAALADHLLPKPRKPLKQRKKACRRRPFFRFVVLERWLKRPPNKRILVVKQFRERGGSRNMAASKTLSQTVQGKLRGKGQGEQGKVNVRWLLIRRTVFVLFFDEQASNDGRKVIFIFTFTFTTTSIEILNCWQCFCKNKVPALVVINFLRTVLIKVNEQAENFALLS
ncbi:hypothetical protein TYRP_005593 [Tyrophagus putrescentiae]|nr:hypothetical protein TYRP_005593 [Tyrophagus putrescentiae]